MIRNVLDKLIPPTDSPRRRWIKRAGLLLALLCILEVSVFNLSFWTTLGLSPTTLYSGEASIPCDEELAIDLEQPLDIETLEIRTNRVCTLKLNVVDEGFSTGYDLEREITPSVPKSTTFALHAYGAVESLSITPTEVLDNDEIKQFRDRFNNVTVSGVTIESVIANTTIPFCFSIPRVAAIFLLFMLIWFFSSKRKMYRESYEPQKHRRVLVISTVVICAAFTLSALPHAMLFGEMEVGSNGDLEYTYPRSYEAQYAELAEAFSQGVPYLLSEPSDSLLESENPYDRTLANRTFKRVDTAYYDGHFYVYFGVLPVLVFYLPFYLVTGTGFPTFIGCMLCLYLTIIAIAIILRQLQQRFFPAASLGAVLLAQACVSFGSMLIWISTYPEIYHMPTALGLACLSWGSVCYLALPRKPKVLALGSLLLASVVACRPQLIAFALFMVPLGIEELRKRRGTGAKVSCLVQALLPFVIVFALVGWYNLIRFGSPLDFGAQYNLTTNDMTRRPSSWESGLLSLFYQFFQLPDLDMAFPFFFGTEFAPTYYSGMLIHEVMYGGLMWLCPFAWFCVTLAFAKQRLLRALAVGMLIVCGIVAIFDGLAAGVLPRYQLDFALPLMVTASLGFLHQLSIASSPQKSESSSLSRVWIIRLGVVCLIVSLLVCVAICFRTTFYNQIGLAYLQYAFTL